MSCGKRGNLYTLPIRLNIRILQLELLLSISIEARLPAQNFAWEILFYAGPLTHEPSEARTRNTKEGETSPEGEVGSIYADVVAKVVGGAADGDGEGLEETGDLHHAYDGTRREGVGGGVEDEEGDDDYGGVGEEVFCEDGEGGDDGAEAGAGDDGGEEGSQDVCCGEEGGERAVELDEAVLGGCAWDGVEDDGAGEATYAEDDDVEPFAG